MSKEEFTLNNKVNQLKETLRLLNVEKENLTTKVDSLTHERDVLVSEIKDEIGLIEYKRNDLLILKQSIKEDETYLAEVRKNLKDKFENLESQKDKLRKEREAFENEKKEFTIKTEEILNKTIEKKRGIESEIEGLETNIHFKRSELANLENTKRASLSTINDLNDDIGRLNKKYGSVKNQMNKDIENLNKKKESIRREEEDFLSTVDSIRKELSQREKWVKDNYMTVQVLKERLRRKIKKHFPEASTGQLETEL